MAGTSTKKAATKKNTATGRTAKKAAKAAAKGPARRVAATAARPPRTAVATSSDHMSASKRIDRRIAELRDWRGERLAEIRALIYEVDPEVVEDWKWMGTPVWSHEGMYALANAHKDKVKLTFCHGAELPDPKKLFNASLDGNTWRAIDLREGDTIDTTALKALLREAVAYNFAHAVPKSKGREPRRRSPGVTTMAGKTSNELTKTAAKAAGPRTTAATSPSRKVSKPALLAGGNPQIEKADGDAPVQAYIAAMPGWKRDVGRRLDALVVRNVPNVRKAVRWNSPFYGIEGRGWFLNFHCFTKYVKVAFFNGASLHPVPPGESKHKDVRYLDIHEDDQLDEVQLAVWVKQASQLPGWGKV
jgi:hypothetical protein